MRPVRQGAVRSEAEVYGIEDAPGAYERLERGEVNGCSVVVPGR